MGYHLDSAPQNISKPNNPNPNDLIRGIPEKPSTDMTPIYIPDPSNPPTARMANKDRGKDGFLFLFMLNLLVLLIITLFSKFVVNRRIDYQGNKG